MNNPYRKQAVQSEPEEPQSLSVEGTFLKILPEWLVVAIGVFVMYALESK